MRRLLPLLLLLLAIGASAAEPPPPVELSAEEAAAVANGEVVIRYDPDEGLGTVTGIVDVAASPQRILDAALDLPARQGDLSSVRSIEIYAQRAAPEQIRARWTVSVLYTSVVFHIVYDVDRERGWCHYFLDPDQPNDIEASQGSYHAYVVGDRTRLVYRSASDSGKPVPGWLRRKLAVDSLSEQLDGIRRRALQQD